MEIGEEVRPRVGQGQSEMSEVPLHVGTGSKGQFAVTSLAAAQRRDGMEEAGIRETCEEAVKASDKNGHS